MRPVICMITAAVRSGGEEGLLLDRIGAAVRAGVHMIQIRQPEMDAGTLVRLVRAAVAVAEGTEARILVSDRADIALAAGAHGVHLRGTSMAATRLRTLVPRDFVIGRSVHSPEEGARAAADGGLDYLVLGTVFETSSKPGMETVGTAGLRAACETVALPVLGVGGMTPPRLRGVADAGSAGFAAIGLFSDGSIERLPAVVHEAIAAFDTRSSERQS